MRSGADSRPRARRSEREGPVGQGLPLGLCHRQGPVRNRRRANLLVGSVRARIRARRPLRAGRDLEAQRMESVPALGHCRVVPKDPAGLVEGEPVPVEQAFQAQGQGTDPPCRRRGAPLAEPLLLEVEVEANDHRREIGLQGAPALELPEDRVVVLDQPLQDRRGEVLGVGALHAPTRADPGRDPLDEREFREEQLLPRHGTPVATDRSNTVGVVEDGPMIDQRLVPRRVSPAGDLRPVRAGPSSSCGSLQQRPCRGARESARGAQDVAAAGARAAGTTAEGPRPSPSPSCWASSLGRVPYQCAGLLADDPVDSHVRAKDLGHQHRAVLLLVVLEDGDGGAAHGQAAAVQGVDEARLALLVRPVADARPPGLVVGAVGAGGDLTVAVLAGQPHLDVVGLGRVRTHVAGAEHDGAEGEAQALQHLFRVRGSWTRAPPSRSRGW